MRSIMLSSLFFALIISGCNQPEPTYDGKSLSYWIDELYCYDEASQIKAINAIAGMKTAALSAEKDLRHIVQGELEGITCTPAMQKAAIRALKMIGSDVPPIDTSKQNARKRDWAQALGEHGRESADQMAGGSPNITDSVSVPLETLINELYTTDPDRQVDIILRIGSKGPAAYSATALLIQIRDGKLNDIPISDAVILAATEAIEQIKMPSHMTRSRNKRDFPTIGQVELLDDYSREYPAVEREPWDDSVNPFGDTRSSIEISLDSARQMSWMGDQKSALALLQNLLKSDTLYPWSRKEIEYLKWKINSDKEGISVKSK